MFLLFFGLRDSIIDKTIAVIESEFDHFTQYFFFQLRLNYKTFFIYSDYDWI